MKSNRFLLHIAAYFRRIDKILWLLMLAIAAFSLLLLKSVSRATYTDYFQTQLLVTSMGFVAAVALSTIDYESLAAFWYLIGGFSVFLMLYTIFFGVSVQGSGGVDARAWISIAGRTFQTSELVKIFFMLTYAKHISVVRERGQIQKPGQVILLALHAAVPVLLCHFQGDDGAAIVFFAMFLCMSLAGGVQLRYFLLLGALVAVSRSCGTSCSANTRSSASPPSTIWTIRQYSSTRATSSIRAGFPSAAGSSPARGCSTARASNRTT